MEALKSSRRAWVSQCQSGMKSPSGVKTPSDEGRLTQDSVALCHQVTALDRGKLRQLIGSLDRASMTRIEEAIKIALELE